jgi:hypothetical protein
MNQAPARATTSAPILASQAWGNRAARGTTVKIDLFNVETVSAVAAGSLARQSEVSTLRAHPMIAHLVSVFPAGYS